MNKMKEKKIGKISSFEDEVLVFKKELEQKSKDVGHSFETLPSSYQEKIVSSTVDKYVEKAPGMMSPVYLNNAIDNQQEDDVKQIVLHLTPDEDDERISTLFNLMQDVGFYKTLKTIKETENYHIKDDFHRFLVQYIKAGYLINLKEKSPLYPGLNMILFKISLSEIQPNKKDDEEKKGLEVLLYSMEQFYSGMISISESEKKEYFSIELAMPCKKNKISIYCAIPNTKKNIFKNHLLAIFPDAFIEEVYDDYNIFNKNNCAAVSEVKFNSSKFFPIKTYKNMHYDPLNIILKSFSCITPSEGGAIQIILSATTSEENEKIVKKIDDIQNEDDIKYVLKSKTFFEKAHDAFFKALESIVDAINSNIFGWKKDKKDKPKKDQQKRSIITEKLKEKNSSRLFNATIRIVGSGDNDERAKEIISELESGFHQFENPNGNQFSFKIMEDEKRDKEIENYIYRVINEKSEIWLNISELTSIFHFPLLHLKGAGGILEYSRASSGASMGTSEAAFNLQINNKSKNRTNIIPESEKTIFKIYDNDDDFKQPEVYNENKNIQKEEELKENYIDKLNDKTYDEYFSDDEILDFNINDNVKKTSNLKISSSNEILEKDKEKKSIQSQNEYLKKEKTSENLKDISADGSPTLLGINIYQGQETEIYLNPKDRLRHVYVIGQTGTGKTTILKNMIDQDIKNGEGCCFIDPHGSDIEDILSQIPAERFSDVIYFNPAVLERPLGLNMLEYDIRFPEQKTFVINELFSIFQKLYSGTPESMGPAFEQYFRNATALVLEDPASGNTMVEISRVLSDESFRNLKLSKCSNMIVRQFWEKIATQADGESKLENIVPYITNKFDVFLSNDYLRPIIAQEKSAFNFREIMDKKKILLVNLSKGRLGEINSNLIGMIIVGKIQMAAMSRVDSLDKKLPPFYLYIDEFQNVTTNSISSILSEARKYSLGLIIAHQYIKQIDEKIKDAVFGNVGSMIIFRIGAEDAEILEKQLSPIFSTKDIINLQNYNAYVKLLVNGEPQKPFNIKTLPPDDGDPKVREYLKETSQQKYGRLRAEIEFEVQEKFKEIYNAGENKKKLSKEEDDFDIEKMLEELKKE